MILQPTCMVQVFFSKVLVRYSPFETMHLGDGVRRGPFLGGSPLDGFCEGKSQSKMDDLEVALFQETPIGEK